MEVWLNGAYVSDDQASVGVFDAAVQHAVGLFETMAARNGTVFRLDRHIDRLIASAQQLSLTERLKPDPLAEAVRNALERSSLTDARIRLTVTGGDLNMMRSGNSAGANDPTVVVVPETVISPDMSLITHSTRAPPDLNLNLNLLTSLADPSSQNALRDRAVKMVEEKLREQLWDAIKNV